MRNDVPPNVMEMLFNNGYEEQIIDIVMDKQDDGNYEISDIPISPLTMQKGKDKIIISLKVYDIYRNLLERISNSETSWEIPFFILGKKKDNYILFEDIVYDITEAESDFHVCNNINKFRELLNDNNYDVISIGHTHGKISDDKKKNTLTEELSLELKDKYMIRDIGLNVSIADIWQLEAFKEIAHLTSNKSILETIIMYNGDMIVISDNVAKINDIRAILDDKEVIVISTGDVIESKKSKK